jgi:Zn-dependent protease
MLYLLGTLKDDPQLFVLLVVAMALSLIIGLSFHEFSHALVADSLGDPTPRRQGRLTLNPGHHLDPFGSLMLVLAGFGWAKPVRINPFNLRFGPKVGMALSAVAGPLSNFLLAGALAVPLKFGLVEYRSPFQVDSWTFGNFAAFLLLYIVIINTTLGVFNLLPIPPMDGSRVAMLLPGEIGDFFRRMEQERWGLGILMLLLALPFLTGGQIDLLGAIIEPIRSRLLQLFLIG